MRHQVTARGRRLIAMFDMERAQAIAEYGQNPAAFRRHVEEYLSFVADAIVRAAEGLHLEQIQRVEAGEAEAGEVKWFNDDLGYGFITVRTADEQYEDVFVHRNGISGDGYKTLRKAARVVFRRAQGRESIEAVDVRPLEERSET